MPVFRDLDFSVFKNKIYGGKTEGAVPRGMFNVMNNTNLQPQLQAIFDGTGKLTSGIGTPTGGFFGSFTTNTSRQLQVGVRLLF
jgi:hypothetical protein